MVQGWVAQLLRYRKQQIQKSRVREQLASLRDIRETSFILSPNHLYACMLSHFSCVWLCVTPWTVVHQVPMSLGFFRQESWSGLPCPLQEVFLTQGLNTFHPSLKVLEGFPGAPVVKNLPCNARVAGVIPGPGRSHMMQGN